MPYPVRKNFHFDYEDTRHLDMENLIHRQGDILGSGNSSQRHQLKKESHIRCEDAAVRVAMGLVEQLLQEKSGSPTIVIGFFRLEPLAAVGD